MVLVLRLSSVAFNYQDGLFPEERLSKTQALFRVKSLPSILEYLGYVSQGYMSVGPHVDYVDYIQYTKKEGVRPGFLNLDNMNCSFLSSGKVAKF